MDLETYMVGLICMVLKERKISHAQFGRDVFENEYGAGAWRTIRNGHRRAGKRHIRLNEFQRMCDYLELDSSEMLKEYLWRATGPTTGSTQQSG